MSALEPAKQRSNNAKTVLCQHFDQVALVLLQGSVWQSGLFSLYILTLMMVHELSDPISKGGVMTNY